MATSTKIASAVSSTIVKSINLLDIISDHNGSISLGKLTHLTGLKKPTCHRLLRTMNSLDFVTQNKTTKAYSLGPKLISLGFSALNSLDLLQEALPLMKKMRDETGETVNLSILDGNEVLIVERFRSPNLLSINLSVGSRLPLHSTSQGKAMLVFLPQAKCVKLLSSITLEKTTSKTIVDKYLLLKELEKIRKNGYAVNCEEFEIGVYAVAGPILNHAGEAFASLNISYPCVRHPEQDFLYRITKNIVTVCAQLSFSHGYRGEPFSQKNLKGGENQL